MSVVPKVFRFSWILMAGCLLLAACGDSTATSTVPAATATSRPTNTAIPATTAPPTTVAPTTAPVTTVAPTTAPPTTVAPTTAAATTTVALDPQRVEAGRKVFDVQCMGCHLEEGKKEGYGPNLSTSQNALNPDYVRGNVRNGRGRMIAFDKTEVSDADLENIILYLRSIHQG